MSHRVRFAARARLDIERLYQFLADRDPEAAEDAMQALHKGWELLRGFPFSTRKVGSDNPFLRELVISFGGGGYVALFEIDDDQTLTILAVRHQREDDFH